MIDGSNVYTKTEAELSLLRALISEPSEAKKVIFKLDPELFHGKATKKIFLAARNLYSRNKPIDVVTLDEELRGDCIAEVVEVNKAIGRMSMADQYIEVLTEARRRRELYIFADAIRRDVGDRTADVDEIVGRIRNFSANFRQPQKEQSVLDALYEAYEEMFHHEEDRFCRTGVEGIDKRLGGLEPGTLTIIGARPSVGKSILGMQTLLFNAAKGKKGMLINREMMKKNFASRMVSNVVGLEAETIKRGTVDEGAVQMFLDAIGMIQDLPVNVLNNPRRPSEIRGAVIEAMEEGGLDLLVVDYLQRLSPDGRFVKRNEAIGSITWALKEISMDFKIPVVLLSQLNRDADNRRPRSSDLKESGDIEQDADNIILLHTPDIDDVPARHRQLFLNCQEQGLVYAETIVAKAREASTGTSPAIRDAQHMKFISPKEVAEK